MRHLTLSIPTPCHENWDQFTPARKGKFCGSCQKVVIDFTTFSDAEIIEYFQRGANTCGRFRGDQLKVYALPRHRSAISNLWAAVFLFVLMLFAHRPSMAQSKGRQPVNTEQKVIDRVSSKADSLPAHITVWGVVSDGTQTLPGVNVIRKGTAEGTVTDVEGKYRLVIDNPKAVEKLVFSFIGIVTTELLIDTSKATNNQDVKMDYDITGLGGIVMGGTRRFSLRRLWWRLRG